MSLVWDPNLEPDLAGYRLHWGTSSRSYPRTLDVGNATNTSVSDLVAGVTYYFAVTAYNAANLESDFSNEVVYTPAAAASNAPPVAPDVRVTGQPGEPLAITLAGSDPDGDPVDYTLVQLPARGWLSGLPPALVYTPYTQDPGSDAFSYTLSDGFLTSAPAHVAITLAATAEPPPDLPSPAIVGVIHDGYGILLTWVAEPGRRYRVLARPAFAPADWTPVSPDINAGGDRVSWADTTEAGISARFYRVELLVP